MKFKEKGITLISLVITIIILLILANVSINLTLGDNGIITKAKLAKEQYERAVVKEEISLAVVEIQSEEASEGRELTLDRLAERLPEKLPGITANIEENIIKGIYKGYDYEIDESFEVRIKGKNGNEEEPEGGENPGEEPEEHEHNYVETSKVDATCTEDGSITYTCECGDSYTEVIKAGHIFVDGFCSCGASDGTVIAVTQAAYIAKSQGQTFKLTNPDHENVTYSVAENDHIGISGNIVTVNEEAIIGTIIPITATLEDASKYTLNMIVAPDVDNGYYAIYNSTDLTTLGLVVNNAAINDVNQNAKLMQEIDLIDKCSASIGNWTPIGNGAKRYLGIFDGQGYAVNNLYYSIDTTGLVYVGLFGYAENATIKKLSVNGSITVKSSSTSSYIGGVCGYASNVALENLINDCQIQGTAGTSSYMGGISGTAGRPYKCINNGKITGNCKYVGGIVGSGSAERCTNNGEVTITMYSTASYVGGIAGQGSGNILQCVNNATVYNNKGGSNIGGIAGLSYASINECYNTGPITGYSTATASNGLSVGGIAGNHLIYGNISDCYNTAKIQGGNYVGGIVGNLQKYVYNCYNTGDVYGTSTTTIAGGILGYLSTSSGTGGNNIYVLSGISVKRSGGTNSYTYNVNSGCGLISGYGATGSYATKLQNYASVSSDELKTYANTLGDLFVNDLNGGYPILAWQVESENQNPEQ